MLLGWLTFIQYFEASIWSAVICGEQQIKKITAAEEELGHLGAIKGANQSRQEVRPIVDFQKVITQLCLEPAGEQKGNTLHFPHHYADSGNGFINVSKHLNKNDKTG